MINLAGYDPLTGECRVLLAGAREQSSQRTQGSPLVFYEVPFEVSMVEAAPSLETLTAQGKEPFNAG